MKCKKKLIIFSVVLLLLLLAGAFAKLTITVHKFLKTPVVAKGQSIHYFFNPGDTIKSLADCLQTQGDLKHPLYLLVYAKLARLTRDLKAGEYLFVGPLTPQQLLAKVASGDVLQHQITFVDGWTFKQMLDRLKDDKIIKHRLGNLSEQQIAAKLNSQHSSLEGLFFPDTYNYIYGVSDIDLLKRGQMLMQQQLQQQWQQRAPDLPYQSPYQALIVASLIQKEATLTSEDSLIAGVIVNRLKKKMFLQIDPTVIYALGSNYNNKLTTADLRVKNPYNTYVYKGLPPGPICMPGLVAIHAALHPAKTKYLYFVAKGDGSHVFSDTLQEHDQAIKKYILNKPNK